MGIPPIHTPAEVLKGFSDDVKKRMWLIHVAGKDIPKDCGLKGGVPGLENTMVLV